MKPSIYDVNGTILNAEQVAATVVDVSSSMDSFEMLRQDGEWTAALEVLLHLQALAADLSTTPLRCLSFLPSALERGRQQLCDGMIAGFADAAHCSKIDDVHNLVLETLRVRPPLFQKISRYSRHLRACSHWTF